MQTTVRLTSVRRPKSLPDRIYVRAENAPDTLVVRSLVGRYPFLETAEAGDVVPLQTWKALVNEARIEAKLHFSNAGTEWVPAMRRALMVTDLLARTFGDDIVVRPAGKAADSTTLEVHDNRSKADAAVKFDYIIDGGLGQHLLLEVTGSQKALSRGRDGELELWVRQDKVEWVAEQSKIDPRRFFVALVYERGTATPSVQPTGRPEAYAVELTQASAAATLADQSRRTVAYAPGVAGVSQCNPMVVYRQGGPRQDANVGGLDLLVAAVADIAVHRATEQDLAAQAKVLHSVLAEDSRLERGKGRASRDAGR